MEALAPFVSALATLSNLGFPLWSIIALLVSAWVITALRRALLTLHDADLALQKAVTELAAQTDKRMALMEQLLEHHDKTLWREP